MIARTLQKGLEDLASWYPVVSVTGPRQSGTSTLVRAAFPDHHYINLVDPSVRARAPTDPSGFIANNPGRLIIDEAQYVPELFSAIQASADAANETGRYILSGSQMYVTRDVTGYLDVRNESEFRLFMKLCATHAGNLLNISSLAASTGASVPTVKNWLSPLESSYVVRLFQPYHANIQKHLTKTPKLFFYETRLLCALLGISSLAT